MSIEELENKDLYQDEELKEQSFFNRELIFDKNQYLKINKKGLESSMTSVNKLAQGIANMIKRKNIMYFSTTVREEPIEIRYARGNTNLPLLLKNDIEDKINKIKSSDKFKIGYAHIGGIQVMIKAHFQEGIDSPVNLAILDNRIKDLKHALLGIIQGILSYKKNDI